jgi:hypothetical protein
MNRLSLLKKLSGRQSGLCSNGGKLPSDCLLRAQPTLYSHAAIWGLPEMECGSH